MRSTHPNLVIRGGTVYVDGRPIIKGLTPNQARYHRRVATRLARQKEPR